jgi:hypothetical protein
MTRSRPALDDCAPAVPASATKPERKLGAAIINRVWMLVSVVCVAALLPGCAEEPKDAALDICKAVAAELAAQPEDIVFAYVRTNPPYEPDRRITIEFDDRTECGGKIRRTVSCDFEGERLRDLEVEHQSLGDLARIALKEKAITNMRRKEWESRSCYRIASWVLCSSE